MIKKLLLIGTLLFVVSGCSSIKETLAIKPEVIQKPALVLPTLAPAKGYPFEFIVITKDNFREKLKQLEESGEDVVFFALTDDGYKALALSVAELRRYISQQNATIRAYKEYYEPTKTP